MSSRHSITKEFVRAIHEGKPYNLSRHRLKPEELKEIIRIAKIMLGQHFKLYSKVKAL